VAIVIAGRSYGIGALIALLVLIACLVLFIVGKVSAAWLLLLIAALALALLL